MSIIDTRTTAFFPGVFDSDGRPWEKCVGRAAQYEAALTSAIKIALLSQRNIYLPIGYFLDSPPMQRICLRHRGSSAEAQAFRQLMQDAVRIANGPDPSLSAEPLTDWHAHARNWVKGSNSNRAQMVYLNSLAHGDADRMQDLALDAFVRQMSLALRNKWQVELGDFFAVCNRMQFRPAVQETFEFHSFVESRLLSGTDTFPHFHGRVRDKVHDIVEACATRQIRLSRSLLNNWRLCRSQLGVRGLTRIEYERLVPMFGHYHHLAFAKSLRLAAVATPAAPRLHKTCTQLVRNEMQKAQRSLRPWTMQSLPLSRIRFQDIYKVRLGKNQVRFETNLDALHDALNSNDPGVWRDALHAHARNIAGVVSLRFTETMRSDPEPLSDSLTEYAGTGTVTPTSTLKLARLTFTLFREFIPNIHRELQVRWFFRQLE